MKILNYKSRWKLLWDLIFYPSRIEQNHKNLLYAERIKLDQEFLDKTMFLKFESLRSGIVRKDFEMPVLEIVIMDDVDFLNPPSINDRSTYRNERKDITKLTLSFHSTRLSLDYLKREAALSLSRILIDRDYLNAHFDNDSNIITFTINTF